MNGIFVKEEDRVNITVYVSNVEDKLVVENTSEDLLERYKGKLKEDDISPLNFKFKVPNYKDNVNIASKSVKLDEAAKVEIDAASAKYNRFISLLKEWDIKNSSGKVIPITSENVDRLNPVLAIAVSDALDEILFSQ